MATKQEEERNRKKDEKEFLDFCIDGNFVAVKTLLKYDPSLINSKDEIGKFQTYYNFLILSNHPQKYN